MDKDKQKRGREIYAFIDAANLFYGGEKSLHWRIDYEKLLKYLREKQGVKKVFYYAGVDVDTYKAEEGKEINLDDLVKYYEELVLDKIKTDEEIVLITRHLERAKFYRDLKSFGYDLRIKPTKVFTSPEGTTTTKANCDVDLTFDMMRYMSQYNEALVMSGDGDFAPILEYLIHKKKKIRVMARAERTAREVRTIIGDDFVDFKMIRKEVEAERPKNEKAVDSRVRGNDKVGVRENEEKKDKFGGIKKMFGKKKIPTFRKGF